ncbi:MAG: hypothetical protein WC924_04890 [Candidatus Gracilibacteria bacterium]
MTRPKEIRIKYEDKILGQRAYGEAKKFYVEDFLDKDILFNFIYEVESHEADLTEEGFSFLSDYYGIENLAKELYSKDPNYPRSSLHENELFLREAAFR